VSPVVFQIEFLSITMVGIKKGKNLAFLTLKKCPMKSLRAAAGGQVPSARLDGPTPGPHVLLGGCRQRGQPWCLVRTCC